MFQSTAWKVQQSLIINLTLVLLKQSEIILYENLKIVLLAFWMFLSDLDFFILKVHVISRVLHTILSSSQIMEMFIKSPVLRTINNSAPLLWKLFFSE